MKERPILFSAPMVLALLDGTKTQTRRIVKPQDSVEFDPDLQASPIYLHSATCPGYCDYGCPVLPCPFGGPGDRLWVRETWRSWNETCSDDHDDDPCEPHCNQTYVAYAATPRRGFRPKPDGASITYLDESSPLEQNPKVLGPWKPSIHMPRWASRITLEVTGVRVERLCSISEADAKAEGADRDFTPVLEDDREDPREVGYPSASDLAHAEATKHRRFFQSLWESINGAGSWNANPWVWAISFKRVTP